ncbi:unnamed protein product, partial [Staurois parvus]
CVSCDWSQLVTWYKAVVNSLVPCDLCDHSQISHVVNNDVRSEILLTTIQRSRTVIGVPREREQSKMTGAVYERQTHSCTAPIRLFIYMGQTG